jgi:hypothetical protein
MMLTFGEIQLTMGGQLEIQSLQKYVTDKKRFYLPKNLVDKFDGHTLWFNITEDEAYNKYRDIEEPHVKN